MDAPLSAAVPPASREAQDMCLLETDLFLSSCSVRSLDVWSLSPSLRIAGDVFQSVDVF